MGRWCVSALKAEWAADNEAIRMEITGNPAHEEEHVVPSCLAWDRASCKAPLCVYSGLRPRVNGVSHFAVTINSMGCVFSCTDMKNMCFNHEIILFLHKIGQQKSITEGKFIGNLISQWWTLLMPFLPAFTSIVYIHAHVGSENINTFVTQHF